MPRDTKAQSLLFNSYSMDYKYILSVFVTLWQKSYFSEWTQG